MKFSPSRIKVGLELTSKCNLRCGMCPLPVLRRLGLEDLRVHHHGDLARVEAGVPAGAHENGDVPRRAIERLGLVLLGSEDDRVG